MFENTKAICRRFLDMNVPGFDLLVMQNGKEILRHMGGYSDLENKVPVRGDELYNIYSCSKPITVTCAMQLWEKGAFGLASGVLPPPYSTSLSVSCKAVVLDPVRLVRIYSKTLLLILLIF